MAAFTKTNDQEKLHVKIIEQSHEILSIAEEVLRTIEIAGRTCYKSEDKITDKSAVKFVTMLRNHGHHAMIEFGDVVVRFITNRGVTHELVRHRLCSFAQESTRYVRYDGEMEFIKPVWWNNAWEDLPESDTAHMAHNAWIRSAKDSEACYQRLLGCGWRPEQARDVLPNSLKTEIVVKGNIREWRHIFTLRCARPAHPQIRALMRALMADLKQKIPVVFDDIAVS